MESFETFLQDKEVIDEYKKALLLNMFKKLVVRMNKNDVFKLQVKKLFIQSTNKIITAKNLIKNQFEYSIDDGECKELSRWFDAYFCKQNSRKPFSLEYKKSLIKKQDGKCMVCGEPLSEDLTKVHVDHIIPWILVGDELKDNYQCLCDICNECKSAHTDYMFKKLIKLN